MPPARHRSIESRSACETSVSRAANGAGDRGSASSGPGTDESAPAPGARAASEISTTASARTRPSLRRGLRLLSLALRLAQLHAADLSGQGLGQVVHDLDLARVGVGGMALAHMGLDLVREGVGSAVATRQHDERLHDVAPARVG